MSVSETLNLWGNGAVTLPKAWRDRFSTKHFMAEETPEGYLIIKPIVDVVYFENKEGFGLHFPTGMEAGALANQMKKAQKKVRSSKKKR